MIAQAITDLEALVVAIEAEDEDGGQADATNHEPARIRHVWRR